MSEQSLEALRDEANSAHNSVLSSMRDVVKFAKQAGDALTAVKKLVGHKNWTNWLTDNNNFKASPETARAYMRIARNWEKLEPELEANPLLTLEKALAFLRVAALPQPEAHHEMSDWGKVRQEVRKCATMIGQRIANYIRTCWSAEEVVYLWCHSKIDADLLDFLDAIRSEIAPFSEVYVDYYIAHRRIMAHVAAGRGNELPADEPYPVDTFREALRSRFTDETALTPYQKQKLSRWLTPIPAPIEHDDDGTDDDPTQPGQLVRKELAV
ncbi:hypothetical protein Pan44_02510 [Caulifigura coniformis]|uniref:DUF3102 domain-containing protein n=1 Tax=Caulifigura coniformis TaxID=2527983 RepID=A0A517S808_9PLAN|nr:DUF3102 domain-containing protein [Caulifigura coniformis]QDT52242.1 hypothetical protein Pan44_02510 [Caulifigura coniformis]